jgi:predicted nucleic acid-binding protein
VYTSIWIDHFRRLHKGLIDVLEEGIVVCHPVIVGELACGYLSNRSEILHPVNALPALQPVSTEEALHFIEASQIMGRGLGYVDVHLLASARLSGTGVWTKDRRLRDVGKDLGLI